MNEHFGEDQTLVRAGFKDPFVRANGCQVAAVSLIADIPAEKALHLLSRFGFSLLDCDDDGLEEILWIFGWEKYKVPKGVKWHQFNQPKGLLGFEDHVCAVLFGKVVDCAPLDDFKFECYWLPPEVPFYELETLPEKPKEKGEGPSGGKKRPAPRRPSSKSPRGRKRSSRSR